MTGAVGRSRPDAVQLALAHVRALSSGAPLPRTARVALHFHPDRLVDGRPILAAMAAHGRYRSQFETGTSNGGLTAHPGGDRWRWESRIFGRAYDDAPAELRPKYGALDTGERSAGPAPRFGSAYLRLTEAALDRATFCFPDSFFEPLHFATADAFSLEPLRRAVHEAAAGSTDEEGPDPLDDYVEAHVHGPVRLPADASTLVLDPSHRGTEVEALAAATGIPVQWHPGYRLTVDELRRHPGYRGPEYVALGERLAEDGVLTPRVLGDAARSGRHDAQDLKRVWHLVARFGLTPPG
ncbi:DUF3626 domain-containing protein [Terracoccus luteus]|uniref:DUF3626 domain-containing protein n=1 Tax=Terracoccus luteus TaxID=53356 RepID=A0A839PWZ6_9MICO|nr:DUF3626 domain-containing protein [Terracoccus luteus]MBB2988047.1 hypothetical protein [Terracoccus luteus]MCP2173698.1 hypothetical protein [Terracoccus luteus]